MPPKRPVRPVPPLPTSLTDLSTPDPLFLCAFREVVVDYTSALPHIRDHNDAYQVAVSLLSGRPSEHQIALLLDTAHHVAGVSILGVGGRAGVIIDLSKLVRAVAFANADKVILAHNHPAGSLKVSEDDRVTTARVAAICSLVSVPLLDHIIVGNGGEYRSMFAMEPHLFQSVFQVNPVTGEFRYVQNNQATSEETDTDTEAPHAPHQE